MSRTMHVDLTPSRRSKRLLQNGYYQPPPGELPVAPRTEYSSEDDDDNVSIHSNNSSIFSERAVHYGESPTSTHRRRRRKGWDSPHTAALLIAAKSDSPILKKTLTRPKNVRHISRSESTKDVSQTMSTFARQEASVEATDQTKKEMKTTITSVKSTSQRFARGESSSLTRIGMSHHRADSASYEHFSNQQNLFESQHLQGNTWAENHGDYQHRSKSSAIFQESTNMDASRIFGTKEAPRPVSQTKPHDYEGRQVQYSSTETSDFEETGISKKEYEALIPLLFTQLYNFMLSILSVVAGCLGYVCKMIYQTTLSIFVFDVWWLSQRTSPLFVKLLRAIVFLFLIAILLSVASHTSSQLFGEESSSLLLPVQSISGVFHILSQKISLFSIPASSEEAIKLRSTASGGGKTGSVDSTSYLQFEEALSKMELQFADKLVEIRNEMATLQKEHLALDKKQRQDFTETLSTLEYKLQKEIIKQLDLSNDEMAAKLQSLKAEIASVRTNRTKSRADIDAELEKIRALLSDRSVTATKLTEYHTKLAAFDARLTTLNNMMIKSMKDFDAHVGNTTYLKEIAKMQFIESILKLMKSEHGQALTDDQNSLHFLFIAWLKKQGFAKVEEVERSMNDLAANTNTTMDILEKKFMIHLDRVRKSTQRRSSTLTLEKIVEQTAATSAHAADMEGQIRDWIQSELAIYSADKIALADHALESAGGFVVSTRCSESYNRKTALISLFGIPIYYNINTPRSVIQASTLPGECWSFKGSQGYIVIALSGSVLPTSFTLEHIPRELSPYGRIDSAPKDFTVLGLADAYDYEGVPLGTFRYAEDGDVIQQFAAVAQEDYFTHVELRISTNWGHPEYTCLYRFRVHGTRRDTDFPLV